MGFSVQKIGEDKKDSLFDKFNFFSEGETKNILRKLYKYLDIVLSKLLHKNNCEKKVNSCTKIDTCHQLAKAGQSLGKLSLISPHPFPKEREIRRKRKVCEAAAELGKENIFGNNRKIFYIGDKILRS